MRQVTCDAEGTVSDSKHAWAGDASRAVSYPAKLRARCQTGGGEEA